VGHWLEARMIGLGLVLLYVLAWRGWDALRVSRARKMPAAWGRPLTVPAQSSETTSAAYVLLAFMSINFLFLFAGGLNALVVLGVLLLAPILRRGAQALGWPRMSYLLTRAFHAGHADEPVAFAVLQGARAVLHARHRNAEDVAWLEERLLWVSARNDRPLSGCSVVAAGMLQVARHDVEGARSLLRSVVVHTPGGTARDVVVTARSWLMAEAAERGAWQEVVDLDVEKTGDSQTRFLGAVARKVLRSKHAAPDFWLKLWWLVAPYPWRTLPMLRRVLSPVVVPESARPVQAPPVVSEHPLAHALAAHASLLGGGRVDGKRLAQLGMIWDAALSNPQTSKHATERCHALGIPTTPGALQALRTAVEKDLATTVRSHRVALSDDGGGGILSGAARALRDALLQDVESAVDTLGRRTEERRALPPLDEWRELLAVQQAYASAGELGGDVTRRLAFSQLHGRTCAWSVWLFNDRKERRMARSAFEWLLQEAIAVGDSEAEALQRKNVAC